MPNASVHKWSEAHLKKYAAKQMGMHVPGPFTSTCSHREWASGHSCMNLQGNLQFFSACHGILCPEQKLTSCGASLYAILKAHHRATSVVHMEVK